MKIIKLARHARVGGELRSPEDGAITVHDDAEADRLIDAGDAEDVSADFAEKPSKPKAE